jgi:hypothetical protein
MRNASYTNMKKIYLITVLSMLLLPICMTAGEKKTKGNVNEQYDVESVEITGKDTEKVSKKLRDEAQTLVGRKYNEEASKDIAQRICKQLGAHHEVSHKAEKGTKPETLKVLFQIEKVVTMSAEAKGNGSYHSQEGFSGNLEFSLIPDIFGTFTVGLASQSDYLLERSTGQSFGYKLNTVGTDRIHLQLNLETYHPKFNSATTAALAQRPDVPGTYRARQNFAPSISADATKSVTITAGLSYQRLQFQYPALHTETAYAGTASVQYHPKLAKAAGYDQTFNASYDLRAATRILDSDFVYTRHFLSADYSLSNKKNTFLGSFLIGSTTGTPPLFERFQMGNSYCLRGWNKFDVAPLGGTSVAQGSLAYWRRYFNVFYDVGSVWDPKQSSGVKQSLGIGYVFKYFASISLAFPIRRDHAQPVLIIDFMHVGGNVKAQKS